MSENLIDVQHIQKSFHKPDGQDLLVIEDVNFNMREGEVIALLGKSGSGKSTLLRIIAGLIAPSQGEVLYRNKAVNGPVPGISMVFQSFALMPWLTVLENVELGLEALGLNAKTRREWALHAIDIIGMDGFENAYPKELSGGMRQRVGFARALVVKPDLLIMDEPFSALDILTSESLRSDLMELWEQENYMKGILFVTHNIEEAVLIADRILVFGSNPGNINGELNVTLPHPRNGQDPKVLQYIDDVYMMLTSAQQEARRAKAAPAKKIDLGYRLPDTQVAEAIGLLEELNELQNRGPVDLPELADTVRLDIDDLFPVLDTLSVLQFAKISEGDISMVQAGRDFIDADIIDKKKLFAQALLEHIPLAKYIREKIMASAHERVNEEDILDTLRDHFTEGEAERVLSTLIDWARYAEIFSYDYNTGVFSLLDY